MDSQKVEYAEGSYQEFVFKLKKPKEDILEEVTADKLDLIHMAMGIAGEAGELMDAVKKHTMYNQPLDMGNVVEELGDLEFFIEGIRQALGITKEMVIQDNRNKLGKRYEKLKFSNEEAKARADKS